MDANDINPKTSLPKPYVKDQERVLVPKLNLTPLSGGRKPLLVYPDPALDVTPLKQPTRDSMHKYKSKNKPKKKKENFRMDIVSPWCSLVTNRTQWVGYDHLLGKKVDQNCKLTTENPKKERRRPTFYNSVSAKCDLKNVDLRSCKVPITVTEAKKFQKPEFNSCLKLAQEIKDLKIVKKGVDNEIAKQMKTEKMRLQVSEKASICVNVPFNELQYTNLIPLDVSPCQVAMKLQEEKEMKMKACKPQPRPRDPEPNVMDFYSDSIYREHCNIHLEIPRLDLNFPEISPRDWPFRHYQQLIERNEPL